MSEAGKRGWLNYCPSHCPEPFDNKLPDSLLLDLDLDLGVFVLDFKDTNFSRSHETLQSEFVVPEHPLEIIAFVRHFYHGSPPNLI